MGFSNVLELLGGVALFLFGMSLMGDSLTKVAGSKLELVLYRLSSTPLKGIILGTGVTAVIQSSSATSVMVVGFVNSGMMKVKQAIGVIMGAIIGTSITGWIICLSSIGGAGVASLFSTSTLTAIIAIVGIVLRMFCKGQTKHHVGEIMLGFAVLMYGISAMSEAVYPLRESKAFIDMLTAFSNPILGILIGMLFTSMLQSASAAVGIMQALAITGAIRFEVALPIIMGIAIGAALPVLLSALGANANGRRTAFIYLFVDTLGVIIFSILFYSINAVVDFSFMGNVMNSVSIALLNTVFRCVIIMLLAPGIGLLEKVVCTLIKDDDEEGVDLRDMDRLEDRFLEHPALAIEQSRQVINGMAAKAQKSLGRSFTLVKDYTDELFAKVKRNEDTVDRYEDKLGTYLVKINTNELTHVQNSAVSRYLHAINDFERMSDHALNIAESAQEISAKNIVFTEEAAHELDVLMAAVSKIVELAVEAFKATDINMAYRIEPLEELIDNLCDEMKLHHVERVRRGECTLEHGFVFNDLLTNLERVADHCSNIGVTLIELDSEEFDVHKYINSVKEIRANHFDEYYNEFAEEFKI